MSEHTEVSYWIFSNKPADFYGDSDFDMAAILERGQYYFKVSEKNRTHIRPGDVIYMRCIGESYLGRFVIGGAWVPDADGERKHSKATGYFPMAKVVIWTRPLPQWLVIRDITNQNLRARIIRITRDDSIRIETAQDIYARLGFGGADGQILILEKGLEEAIKPNLARMGLRLADERICQQFAMGPGVGRSDLICVDANNDLVVLELKRGFTSDETIGQVLRYIGYVMENIAVPKQKVYGAIVASDYDEQLRLAAKAAGVKLYLVRLG